MINLKGTKLVEVPYFLNQIVDTNKEILIVGERFGGGEGVSENINLLGCENVTTTDILESPENSWLKNNTTWEHIQTDFINFNEELKYDFIIAISVFEHFGFWFAGNRMASNLEDNDICRWNHDLRAIEKSCKLLKNKDSKLIITLPGGPYMNYEDSGEPFLRYYDLRRQNIIKNIVKNNNCYIEDESFYYSRDFINWSETEIEIMKPEYNKLINSFTPNLIWGITIKIK